MKKRAWQVAGVAAGAITATAGVYALRRYEPHFLPRTTFGWAFACSR